MGPFPSKGKSLLTDMWPSLTPLRSNNPTLSPSPTLSTPFNMLWRPPSLTSTPSAYTNPLSPSALSLPPLLLHAAPGVAAHAAPAFAFNHAAPYAHTAHAVAL